MKAKNAIVKANAGTVQTLIQAELADTTSTSVNVMVGAAGGDSALISASGIHIPDGVAQGINGTLTTDIGMVYVVYDDSTPGSEFFTINGNSFDDPSIPVYTTSLTARK